jgi:SAM-dependent methyltransferase
VKSVPSDYYRRLAEIDAAHWWACGMIRIEAVLLRPWLERGSPALLDAGCGPGGFLAWAQTTGRFGALAGVDLSPEAIAVAQERVRAADLRVAPLDRLPFEDAMFHVAALNDVLQHVHEGVVEESLSELRRVLRRDGALVVRTGGARHSRRERPDWRVYDKASLRRELARGGFAVRRATYVNTVFSALGELRGRRPHAPTRESCGVPERPGALASGLGSVALSLEARVLSMGGSFSWGHTLVALAVPE